MHHEVSPRDGELKRLAPLSENMVRVARDFHEIAPPSGNPESVQEMATQAARSVSTPSQRAAAEEAAEDELEQGRLEGMAGQIWAVIRAVEQLQASITKQGVRARWWGWGWATVAFQGRSTRLKRGWGEASDKQVFWCWFRALSASIHTEKARGAT